jgi:hypothetical protein
MPDDAFAIRAILEINAKAFAGPARYGLSTTLGIPTTLGSFVGILLTPIPDVAFALEHFGDTALDL